MKHLARIFTKTLIILIITANASLAQKIKWGELNSAASKNYYPTIIDEDKEGIYTVASLKSDYVVEKYNRDNQKKIYATLVKTKGEKYKENKVSFEGVANANDKFVVFTSYFEKKGKKKTTSIFAFKVDKKTGKKDSKKTEIFEIPVEKKKRDGSFVVFSSDDGKRILVRHTGWYKKQKKYKVMYKLLDENLEVITEKSDQYSSGAAYSLGPAIIDNDGSVYFTKVKGDNYYIVSFDADKDYEKWEEKVDYRKLGMSPGSVISSLNFNINANDNLVLTGYYSTNKATKKGKKGKKTKVKAKDRSVLAGCFFLKIDKKSKEIVNTKINKFDKKFNDQFKTKKDEKKGKEANVKDEFKLIEVLNKDDGGVILIGEKYQHIMYYDQDHNLYAELELYLDLVVINMSPEGDLIWANKVPKFQKYYYNTMYYPLVMGSFGVSLFGWPMRITEHFSYMAGMDKDNVYVIFNDNPANSTSSSDQDRSKPLKKLNKAAPVVFTMNLETGKKDEKLFLEGKDFKTILKPIVNFQRNQGSQMITFGKKGKKYKFGVLDF